MSLNPTLDRYATLDLHFGWRLQLSEPTSAGFTVAVRKMIGEVYVEFWASFTPAV